MAYFPIISWFFYHVNGIMGYCARFVVWRYPHRKIWKKKSVALDWNFICRFCIWLCLSTRPVHLFFFPFYGRGGNWRVLRGSTYLYLRNFYSHYQGQAGCNVPVQYRFRNTDCIFVQLLFARLWWRQRLALDVGRIGDPFTYLPMDGNGRSRKSALADYQ